MSSATAGEVLVESPLIGCGSAVLHYRETTIRERAFLGHINLRGNAAVDAFAQRAAQTIGVALPTAPDTTRAAGERVVCWLCPSEWLIVCAGADEVALARDLTEALRGELASVVRIGGGQTVLAFEGQDWRELLAKGCPLDLHPRAFAIGQCAQTHVAKAPALLRPVTNGVELVVRRSFADYLWRWLEAVAR